MKQYLTDSFETLEKVLRKIDKLFQSTPFAINYVVVYVVQWIRGK